MDTIGIWQRPHARFDAPRRSLGLADPTQHPNVNAHIDTGSSPNSRGIFGLLGELVARSLGSPYENNPYKWIDAKRILLPRANYDSFIAQDMAGKR